MNTLITNNQLVGQLLCPSGDVRPISCLSPVADDASMHGHQTVSGHGFKARAYATTEAIADGTWTGAPEFGKNRHSQRWRMVS